MFLIQNLACIPASLKGNGAQLTPEKPELKNKWIDSLFVLSSEEDSVLLNPFNQQMVTQLFDNEHLHLFIRFDKSAPEKEINAAFFSIRNYNLNFKPLLVSKYVDFNNIELISRSTFENAEVNSLVYFNWQNKTTSDFFPELTGSAVYEFAQNANTEKKLTEIITDDKVENKLIKKINIFTQDSYSPSLLDIVCKDGRKMEFIPSSLLQLPDEYEIYFENIEIDFNESRFIIPTFNEKEYNYTITFGW